mmetsp:Transcript_20316/g.29952  ORF Transcript_20316/g.29952 Transcript_20316/m.29952 type:complete len:103 (-) Transcript_20316:232-540(-)
MDDWTLYQLTGDPAYIQSFRRKRALKHAAMGGSFLGLAVVSTGLVMTEVTSNRPGQQSFVPPNLPKKSPCGHCSRMCARGRTILVEKQGLRGFFHRSQWLER